MSVGVHSLSPSRRLSWLEILCLCNFFKKAAAWKMAGYSKRKGVHHLVVKSLCLLFYHIISTATSFHPNCLYMFEAPRMALFRSRRSCDTAVVQPLTDLNCNISTIVLIKLMVLSGWNHKRVGFLFESSVRSISCC